MPVAEGPLPVWLEPRWREFFASEATRPDGLSLYEDVFNGSLLPLQRKAEMVRMMDMARSIAPKRVMEIGADKLGGFYHWIKCLPTVTGAIASEYRGVHCIPLFAAAFPSVQILGVEGSSYAPENVERVRQWLGAFALDCLFIDGDKDGTAKDFAAYAPMVRKGGLVFIHDVTDDIHPGRFFRTLGSKYKTELIYDTSELADIEARERAGLKPANSYEGWYRIWRATSCGVGVVYV